MKLFTKLNFKRLQIAGLLAVITLGISSMLIGPQTTAISLPGPFDKDANAVLCGGASDTKIIWNDYNNGVHNCKATDGTIVNDSARSIQDIYGYKTFGITSSDIKNLGTDAVAGTVTNTDNVYVGKQLVATDAVTVGRLDDRNHQSKPVTLPDGTKFFIRPPHVSFKSSPLAAYVVMRDGQFKFAILSSCGNAVVGKPKPPVKGMLACTQLLATPGNVDRTNGDTDYTFTAKATATNATISQYAFDFGAGHGNQVIKTNAKSAMSKKVTYIPGTYTVSVKVSGVAKGMFTAAPTPVTCTKSFTVPKPKQKVGTLTCDSLTLDKVSTDATTGDVTYKLDATATPTNATISQYVFTFGNGADSPQTVKTRATSATSKSVVYAAGKSYNSIFAVVSGKSNSGGKALSAGGAGTKCAVKLNVPKSPKPFQKCVALTPFIIDEQSREVRFTVTTDQGNGSTLQSADFNFDDGVIDKNVKPATDKTIIDTHTFAEDKTYNISATVHFNTPGGVKDVNCTTSVTFTATPTPTCDGLTLTSPSDREVDVAISYTPNGATLTSASINFGDKTSADTVMPAPDGSLTDKHPYAAAAGNNFNVTASLLFSINGRPVTVDGSNCAGAVSFTTSPTCTAPNGQKFPVGSKQCKPTCTAPNGQTFPVNSPHCKPLPPVTTTAITTPLPNTGAGNVIGLFAGASIVGSVVYRLFLARRLARR